MKSPEIPRQPGSNLLRGNNSRYVKGSRRAPVNGLMATTKVKILRELFAIAHENRITNVEIADRLGVHAVSVSNWKVGFSTPDARTVELMAAALGYKLALEKL